jgi:hypothetical protein
MRDVKPNYTAVSYGLGHALTFIYIFLRSLIIYSHTFLFVVFLKPSFYKITVSLVFFLVFVWKRELKSCFLKI